MSISNNFGVKYRELNTINLQDLIGTLATQSTGTPNFNQINYQVFFTSGTYEPSANMVYCVVECQGGGGAGGSATGTVGQSACGGGGGGGGYSKDSIPASLIGSSQPVYVGTGGQGITGAAGSNGLITSFGSPTMVSAAGGHGGSLGTAGAIVSGGAPGIGLTKTVTLAGQVGGFGIGQATTGATPISGNGGNSYFGFGAQSLIQFSSEAGNSPTPDNYGSGGSGAIVYNSTGSQLGGNGANGIVVITEYISNK